MGQGVGISLLLKPEGPRIKREAESPASLSWGGLFSDLKSHDAWSPVLALHPLPSGGEAGFPG